MLTTVYLIRHAEVLRKGEATYLVNDSEQVLNEKNILCVNGEKKASELSKTDELKNIDVIWSSNYTRAMATAKYIAYENNIPLNIDERFGERKIGDYTAEWDEYWAKQYYDPTYKFPNGENQEEVRTRFWSALKEIIDNNAGKRIAVVAHSTAIAFMLFKWCELKELEKETYRRMIYFKDQEVINDQFNTPEVFKLIIDNGDLIDIKRILY